MDGRICTFFGHRDCPADIRPRLRAVVLELIERHGVRTFYLGNQGAFDALALSVLREVKSAHPAIDYAVVLAYPPRTPAEGGPGTLLPDGIEKAPKRFAISRRNRWMLGRADCVVAYVAHSWGGAAQFTAMARRQGKTVYNLHAPDRTKAAL